MCSGNRDKESGPLYVSLEESMRLSLNYFEGALMSASKSPEDMYLDFGSVRESSWELLQEIVSGKSLVEWDGIGREQRGMVREIVDLAENMPRSAFKGRGLDDFFDPAWGEVRAKAMNYLARVGACRNEASQSSPE